MKHWKQITDRMAMVCLDTQKLPQDLQIQYAFFKLAKRCFSGMFSSSLIFL